MREVEGCSALSAAAAQCCCWTMADVVDAIIITSDHTCHKTKQKTTPTKSPILNAAWRRRQPQIQSVDVKPVVLIQI